MLSLLRKNSLTSLFKEVRICKAGGLSLKRKAKGDRSGAHSFGPFGLNTKTSPLKSEPFAIGPVQFS